MEGFDSTKGGFNGTILPAGGQGGGTSFKDLGYEDFDPAETYAAGNVVIYDGKLYEFTASHPAGAWTGTDAKETSVAESIAEGKHPYISLERLRQYLYRVTFDGLPQDNGGDNPVLGGCSSYVKDGKLYRNLDWNYDNSASFIVRTRDFEGMSFVTGLNDGQMDDSLIAQLPYRVVDGINNYGIKVSTHVLFNDWEWDGVGEKSIPLTRLPFEILTRVKSMASIATDLDGVLGNLAPTEAMGEYLLQVLVTDGASTYAILPPTSANNSYVLQDISANPKLTNFRWLAQDEVSRTDADLQTRPTGIERFNLMPCPLKDLRFTKAYEAADRLSEFIGIDGTTKDSTDEELTEIYNLARAEYLDRERDGKTWQTMHSVVYGGKMESLYIQENWDDNVIPVSAESLETIVTEIDSKIADNSDAIEVMRKMLDGNAVAEFDAGTRYNAGTYVLHEGYVYRFTEAHEIGAWSGNDAVQTSAFNELMNFVVCDVENIYIQLGSSDGELTLEGLQVQVTFEDGSPTQVLTADEYGKCNISVDKGKTITLSVADQTGYQHVPAMTLRTVSNVRYVFFTYEEELTSDTCTVTVTLVPSGARPEQEAEIVGKTVNLTFNDGTARSAVTDSNGVATFLNVRQGLEGTTQNPKLIGFVTPAKRNFSTNFVTVGLTLTYNAIVAAGIFMVNQDGDDVTYAAWDTADTLVAIHVATQELVEAGCDYYVPVEEFTAAWNVAEHRLLGQSTRGNYGRTTSSTYIDGMQNTANVIAGCADAGISTPAYSWAVNQTISIKGNTLYGYIGTYAQALIIVNNFETIAKMLELEGFVIDTNTVRQLSSDAIDRRGDYIDVFYISSVYSYTQVTGINLVMPFFSEPKN